MSLSVHAQDKVVAGYFADWQYNNPDNPYQVKDIPAENLTHIIYAFLSMCGPHTGASEVIQKKQVAEHCKDKAPFTAIVVDQQAALQEDFGPVSVDVDYKGHFAQLAQLKKNISRYRHTAFFLVVGLCRNHFMQWPKTLKPLNTFSKTAVELIANYDFF
ncbi:glycosyl hydrolase family 18 protein [Vibrio sinaloensis]|nr:glycosyl hydrolase family 18 protein [Vibrio sinaloensis]